MLMGTGLAPVFAALNTFSLPSEDQSWKEAQQGPLLDTSFLEVVDFKRFDDGIAPLEPFLLIEVPLIPPDVSEEELRQEDLDSLFSFSQNIAQRDVVALELVVLERTGRSRPGKS